MIALESCLRWDTTCNIYYSMFKLCIIEEVTVVLVNGNSINEGRVQLTINGDVGTVCDDGWDFRDATVVCQMLGYDK